MDYKLLPEYKDILNMGYVDITDIYKSSKEVVAFQHKSEVGREPKNGDIRYVVQKSGYIRNPIFEKGWNANGRILDKFEDDSPDFKETGIKLLSLNLKVANGLLKRGDTYKQRAEIKVKTLIKRIFKEDGGYYNRALLYAIKGGKNDMSGAVAMLDDPKKIYQGIVKLAKELGF